MEGVTWRHVLLTGPPGIGKTTVVRKVYEKLKDVSRIKTKGFYTEEIRSGGKRIGFDVCCLDGKRGSLARIGSNCEGPRVGQYTVDLSSFEQLALPALECDKSASTILIIDEIGKMELFSRSFQLLLKDIFNVAETEKAPIRILATIPVNKGKPLKFVEELKKRRDVEIYAIGRDNREDMVSIIFEKLIQLNVS